MRAAHEPRGTHGLAETHPCEAPERPVPAVFASRARPHIPHTRAHAPTHPRRPPPLTSRLRCAVCSAATARRPYVPVADVSDHVGELRLVEASQDDTTRSSRAPTDEEPASSASGSGGCAVS